MALGVEANWQKMKMSLSRIRVANNGVLLGIDSNTNLMVPSNCFKANWIQASSFKFDQVHMVDGKNVLGVNDELKLAYTTNLNSFLLPYPATSGVSSLPCVW
jgi:hypothetical protein